MRIEKSVRGKAKRWVATRLQSTTKRGINPSLSGSLVSIPRLPRGIWKTQIMPISANFQLAGNTSSASGVQAKSYNFTMSLVGDYTSYQAIFDQYMIYEVDITIIVQNQFALPGAILTSDIPNLITCIDYDDSTALTSLGQALNFHTAMIHPPQSRIVRKFRPKCASGILDNGAIINAGGSSDSQWLNCANPSIPHYGFKTLWEQAASGSSLLTSFSIYCKMKLLFRNTR